MIHLKTRLVVIKLLACCAFSTFSPQARGEAFSFSWQTTSERTIQGKVTSREGNEALAGVSVTVKGTTNGTSTDAQGAFTLSVPDEGAVLVFSYIGYVSREIPVKNQNSLSVVLSPNSQELSQIVVIGYGTTTKSDLTGSVASVKSEEILATPTTSFDQALQGRAAGVQVTQTSGKPGAEASIRIRGTSSINAGNEPLYVIDGMLVSSDANDMSLGVNLGPRISALSTINPNDIESIEVLKDASATAIYGSRGTNGVVLITTKRGKSGTGTVTFDTYYGVQEVANKLEVLNAAQFADFVNEAKINANQTPIYNNPATLGAGTDWQGEIFRTAPIANYQLSFSGGDEKTRYAITGGYFVQDGIIRNSDFKRYSFRANLDRDLSSKLAVGNSVSYSRLTSSGVLTTTETIVPGVTTSALLFNPILPVYNPNEPGGYTFENRGGSYLGKTLGNPVADVDAFTSYGVSSRILGNVYARYKILENLEFRTSFGIDGFSSKENAFGPNFLKRTEASKGEASIGTVTGLTWLNENTLTYRPTINEDHKVDFLLGYTLQEFNNESLLVYAFDFPDDRTGYHDISAGLLPQKPANGESRWSMVSYLGRANYTLFDRFLFTATGRVDGSSKFASGKQYGFFPSGAVAWRLSDEAFIQQFSFISDLKLRTSYGIIGNQAIPPYQSLSLVGAYGQGVFNGTEVYTGREPLSFANKNLKWETTAQFDLGLDASFWNNRLSVTADIYEKKTSDLLLSTPVPYTTGFNSTVLNVGNIRNRGFEFDVRTINTKGALDWRTSLNFTVNRNEVTNLNSETDILMGGGTLLRVGEPVGTFYGYIFEGIFQTDEEARTSPVLKGQEATSSNPASRAKAGDRKYRDINGDQVIDEKDRSILGSAQPDFTWGLTNTLSFKNIDLSFFFQGSQGNKMANLNLFDLQNFTGQNNVLAEAALNRWTPNNPSTKYPRALAAGSLDNGVFSSNIVEDASYIRLKNVSLGYRVPSSLTQKVKVKTLRIYASATNLWTLTDYSGYDSEANTFGQSTAIIGVDRGGYPQAKTYLVGLNIGF
ncbi:SusC/RagA family TonB-linked outer membrane protein [Rufibacter latericius]|uniref:TonB-dependent receptor n=1 Tax=Rufibacter latericius TaxID=2487040 RepID=A0A3M9MAS5_9BACT|nr:TonB-dependent receptor [Rufibacter latericius]RNI22680.1 TonB-dependent receptor [Rufibacter latericius]